MSGKNNKKNQARTTKTGNEHRLFITALVWLLIGLVTGYGLFYVIDYRKQTGQLKYTETDGGFEFINPYVLTSVYDSINHTELMDFKNEITRYCDSTLKSDTTVKHISYYFRDLGNAYWFGVNERENFIPASLTKVPILIATLLKAQKDSTYLDKEIVYIQNDIHALMKKKPEFGMQGSSLEDGKTYTVMDLIQLMVIKSDDEAGIMLYNDFGFEHWNNLLNRLTKDLAPGARASQSSLSVKGYSSFFRVLYNASLLNRKYSEMALEILSRTEYYKGIRLGTPPGIIVSHRFGERNIPITPNNVVAEQVHNAAIVYYPGKTYFLCVMTRGSDKPTLEKIIFDLARVTYNNIDEQVKFFNKPTLESDIN